MNQLLKAFDHILQKVPDAARIEVNDEEGNAIVVERPSAPVVMAPYAGTAPAANAPQPADNGQKVLSPIVGTFYAAPAPDAPPFVKVGDKVTKGQPLCIIEAMKLMNEIESEYTGTVTQIAANNGDLVEYGQPLFIIEE